MVPGVFPAQPGDQVGKVARALGNEDNRPRYRRSMSAVPTSLDAPVMR